MRPYHIAVTGLNTCAPPCPGLGVIKSLRQEPGVDVKIIGLAYELLDGACYLDQIVDEIYVVPFPQGNEEKYLSRMSEVVEKTKIDVFIPNLDFEVPIFSKLEPDLRDFGIKMLLPSESALLPCKKENLPQLAAITNIHVPYTIAFEDRRKIANTASHFTYPLVIKSARGESSTVYNLEEAIVFGNRISSHWGWPLIMQGYINGDEYAVISLADRKHSMMGCVCIKKIVKSKNGDTWMGCTVKDDTLVELTKRILTTLKWVGPIEIEFIKEQDTKRYVLIEINPRFPTWVELAAKAGCNLPMAVVRLALRQKQEPYDGYDNGILFARSEMDIIFDVSRLGQLATRRELIYHGNDHKG